MRNLKNCTSLIIVVLVCVLILSIGCGNQAGSKGAVTADNLPRNETLYFNGLQWGTPMGNNPYGNTNNAFAEQGHRQLQFETLFAYNLLDGKLYPQIGDSYSWSDRTLTVQLNKNVKFSDGTALTSADIVYVFDLAKKYTIGISGYWQYLDSVTAQGDYTVIFQGKEPPNFNMKQMEAAISEVSITPKFYWESKIIIGLIGEDVTDLFNFMGWDCYGTGPYKFLYNDDTKIVLVRDDDYWGKHPSRYGKLPVPKYIAHNIFENNVEGDYAFRRGEVDVSQQFVFQIWNMWDNGLPIETYISQSPYYLPGVIPSLIFNTTKPGLNDKAVRKAIAMAIDYEMIRINSMSEYTAQKQASMMLPLPQEQALIDLDALKPYQWEGIDINGAFKLLNDAGWTVGLDGIRAKGDARLSFRVECPYGWSDWNASLQVVARATILLGMDIKTYFPSAEEWSNDRFTGNFDIIVDSPGGQGISAPWSRAYAMMYSKYLPPVGTPNMLGNWGRYSNARVDTLIDRIASETNAKTLKALWTELNQVYLDEMPAVGLMYRPWLFHQVNASVWTGFPRLNDGTNVPPTILADGYGIKGLYNLKLKK
jgi:peptide/nickel transport system substrate-binding protein